MVIKNAFRVGLIGALGVGLAMLLMTMVGSLATVLTYIGVAFFLALGLDPAVLALLLEAPDPERLAFKKGGAALIDLPKGPEAPGQLLWFLKPRILRALAGK